MDTMDTAKARSWFIKCILSLSGLLLAVIALMVIVDPYFHYHRPLSFLSYRLYEERYINDGISRHFDYDAMITGTSMAQNFKPSEFDALFGTQSVKETFSGAGYQELSDNLSRALSRNEDLKTVLWALDYNGLLREYDWIQYEGYPEYLYDDNPFNDAAYLLNKSILYHGVLPNLTMTLTGQDSTTMDEYSSWERETGLTQILNAFNRDNLIADEPTEFSSEDLATVTQTITANVLSVVNQYPDTTFYIFYPPYSICYWDSLHIKGTISRQIQAEQAATELLLTCPNVKLFNFYGQYDIVCNPDYYSDDGHYSAEINSRILAMIADGTGRITRDNYRQKLEEELDFYSSYDYESIYAGLADAVN